MLPHRLGLIIHLQTQTDIAADLTCMGPI